jgi:hypothetical protein
MLRQEPEREAMTDQQGAINNFKVALSEFTTSLEGAMAKVQKMKQSDACQCVHCKNHLENLEGQTIPMLNGQIAAIRAVMLTLQDE